MKLVNIYNKYREIYLFLRNKEGQQEIKKVNNFFHYLYEHDINGKFKGFDGTPLRKIFICKPSDIRKQRSDKSYEGDIRFCQRYMIDAIDKLDKCPIKYSFIDIEILSDELPDVKKANKPVSCISVSNSFSEKIKTFYLEDYETEYKMIDSFIEYLKQEKFDILLGWNFTRFDFPYLCNRYPDFAESISPIGQTRYGDGEIYYPAGISIIDYLSWFKKVTLNREQAYSLDYIAKKHLGRGKKHMKLDFSKLSPETKERNIDDVKILVELEKKHKIISYFDEIRRMSKIEWEDLLWNSRVLDMLLLQEAKNQKVALPMKPDEMRGTLSEKEDFAGAFREAFKTGAFTEGTGIYDLSSCYPSMIIDFCLDPANIRKSDKQGLIADGFDILPIENSHFAQNSNALLPTVVKKLITLKNQIKSALSKCPINSGHYKDIKKRYDAVKTVVNSAYGVFGNRFFRLYNKQVASATTFLVRDLLHYVITALKSKGYEVIYVDTDGVMINNNTDDISNLLNSLVKKWAKDKYGKENIVNEFEYKGYYEKILILTKCRYLGYVRTDKGLEEEVKGVEAKRKDSTVFMKKFQRTLIDKILDKESKESIFVWIKNQIKEIRNQPLQNIAFPCKIGKPIDEYKNMPIFVRASKYAQELVPSFKKKVGELFYYIYVNSDEYEQNKKNILWYDGGKLTSSKLKKEWELHFGQKVLVKNMDKIKQEELIEHLITKGKVTTHSITTKGKLKNVMAFDEETYGHVDKNKVDWETMKNRNILMKLQTIFEAMGWNIKEIIGIETKDEVAEYINKLKNEKQFAREVSKKTCRTSSSESRVQVSNLAPNIDIVNQEYQRIQKEKKQIKELDFELKDLEIKKIDFREAKKYIIKNHYSHTIASSVKLALGFYYNKELVTAVVYGCPIGRRVTEWLQIDRENCVELIRLFSKDGLPKNIESYCIGQSFKYIRQNRPEFKYLISYADPNHGHIGYIYQATNWRYVGVQRRLLPERRIFIDGKEVHTRNLNAKHGSTSKKNLEQIYGDRLEIKSALKKHVYLMCLGNKKEKRDWYKKFPEQPYPKIKDLKEE